MSGKRVRDERRAKRLEEAVTARLADMSGQELIALLRDKGFTAHGDKQIVVHNPQATQAALNTAYQQGYKAGDGAADRIYREWVTEAQSIDLQVTAILNFVTGVLTLMYGRDLDRQRVIVTFERPAADLLDVLHRADIFNRRFQAAFKTPGIDLSQPIALRELMANAIAAATNGDPISAETLLAELQALRPAAIVDRMAIIREANKPGRKEETAAGYIVEQVHELMTDYPTWRRRAEVLIESLAALDYRTPAQEDALKQLREQERTGTHGEYIKNTYHNARKKAAADGLSEAKNRVKLSTTLQNDKPVLT